VGNRIQWILLRRGLVADETTLTTKCIGVFYCHFAVMKTILGTRIITVPDKVTITCKCRTVTVKGPRGTLTKSFKHIDLELTQLGKKRIRVDIWFATRKQMACLRTICSHIENLFKGVLYVRLADFTLFFTFTLLPYFLLSLPCYLYP
jgi:hypothetical protein